MNIINDQLNWAIVIAAIPMIISTISLCLTVVLWRKTNKPIVTAIIFVDSPDNPNPLDTLNLIIHNSGNRPATSIRLEINPRLWFKLRHPKMSADYELKSIFNDKAAEEHMKFIKNIFSKESELSILLDGEKFPTSFGSFYFIKVGSHLPIIIKYSDLENRNYKSKLKLSIRDRKGFGGGTWQ